MMIEGTAAAKERELSSRNPIFKENAVYCF
jgi:hypothetical protein